MKKEPAKQKSPSKAPERAAKGTLLDFAVSSLDAEGYGLATHGNRQVLISGALPGELVRAKITHAGEPDILCRDGDRAPAFAEPARRSSLPQPAAV